jgi:hypothetical protein
VELMFVTTFPLSFSASRYSSSITSRPTIGAYSLRFGIILYQVDIFAGIFAASIIAVCDLDSFFVFAIIAFKDIEYLLILIVLILVGGTASFLADQLH